MSEITQSQPIDLTVDNKDMDEVNNNTNDTKIVGIAGVPEEHVREYKKNYKAHEVGISHDEMVKVYSNWAKNYDQDLQNGCYNGPEIAAEEMSKYYPVEERPFLKILDVAAGTGRVGEKLAERGFKIIDALEPSKGMMEVLIEKKIYGKTYERAVGYKPVAEIRADTYDALVIAGGMGEGHIPVGAIDEFLRVVRPGGLIFIVMREEYLQTVKQYSGKLEPFMKSIVEKGLWMQIQRKVVQNYSFGKNGVVYVYQKTE